MNNRYNFITRLLIAGIFTALVLADGSLCRAGVIRHDDVDGNASNNDTDGNAENGLDDALYRARSLETRYNSAVELSQPGRTTTCSGVLIAPEWVLTAGHCLCNRDEDGVIQDRRGIVLQADNHLMAPITSSLPAIVHPLWQEKIRPWVTTDTTASGNAQNAGFDFALIRLSSPSSIQPAMRNSTPLTSGHTTGNNDIVTLVGYGRTGTGVFGDTEDAGTRRAGENVIDGFDGDGGTVGTVSYPSNNQILMDFDRQGSTVGTLGSDTPRMLEYSGAGGDSGGPWYWDPESGGLGTRVVAIHSQSRNGNLYGGIDIAGRVDLVNDWINATMGGVNWNSRTTVGSIPFDTADAWGDGRVPGAGKDVRFSLPAVDPFLFGSARIGFTLSTSVRNVHVEFGPHEFLLGGTTFEATGRVTVDRGGSLSITDGYFTASDQLWIGETDDTSYFTDGKVKVGTGGRLIVSDDTTNGLFVGQNGYGVLEQTDGRVEVHKDAFFGNVGTPDRSQGTYEFSGGTASFARHLYVGNYGDGVVNQSGSASGNVGNDLYVGLNTGEGLYNITGGTLYVNRFLFVGYRGKGTFDQSFGETTAVSEISLGRFDGSEGSLYLRGGSIASQDDFVVGYAGQGTMSVTGGTAYAGSDLYVGLDATGTGTVHLNPSFLNTAHVNVDGKIVVGQSGHGEFIQDTGSVDTAEILVARYIDSSGTYQLNGGTIVSDRINVGDNGTGTFVQNGGNVNVAVQTVLGLKATPSRGVGTYTLENGAFETQGLRVGLFGKGIFEQNGGVVTVKDYLTIAEEVGSEGSYKLTGGELDVSNGVITLGSGTSAFEFTGGTLHASFFDGDLHNEGGTLLHSNLDGWMTITGNYHQEPSAVLQIDLGSALSNPLEILGENLETILNGSLQVSLVNGFDPTGIAFNILHSTSPLSGTLANLANMGARIGISQGLGSFQLTASTGVNGGYGLWLDNFQEGLAGDFDSDGDVDGRDFLAWQRNTSIGNLADWQANYGSGLLVATNVAVPEPSSLLLVAGGGIFLLKHRVVMRVSKLPRVRWGLSRRSLSRRPYWN